MSSYLPERCFVVCTYQLGTDYRQLEVSDTRSFKTVKWGSQNRVLLVKIDKKLNSDFTCKTHWCSGAGTAAIGAGIILGMSAVVGIALAASIAIPIVGLAIAGLIAIGCLVWGLREMFSRHPTCNMMIGYEESQWFFTHQTVRLDSKNVQLKDKQLALVKNSKLACKEGGVLLPFISESLAKQAAESIGTYNQGELGTDIIAGLFSGIILGYTLGGATTLVAALKIGVSFAGWTIAGTYVLDPYVFKPATNTTSDLAANVQGTTPSYDTIKEIQKEEQGGLPDPTKKDDTIQSLIKIRSTMVANKAATQNIAEIDNAIKAAQSAGTYKMNEVPEVKQVLENIQSGKYGDEAKKIFTNKIGTMSGMNREGNYNKAQDRLNDGISERNSETKLDKVGLIGLAFPFISSYFGNNALRVGAQIYDEDTKNAIPINSKYY